MNATCTPESSSGANDGTASSNASGGCPPLSYLWSTGETTPDISGLSPGWYVVTVTDDEGCTVVDSCEVLAASCPPLTISIDCDTICPGANNGTATATVSGGCPPYDFIWSNGSTGNTATGLSAGLIEVTVTDSSGQAITAACTVDECPPIVVNATCTPESSSGANDGTASSNASGGCPPLSYLWSTGETTPDISGLSPGWYVVTVTDDEGCTVVDSCEVLAASCPPLTISIDCDTICPGANNGTATATVSGGCPPYDFIWSNGSTGNTATGLSAGLVEVTVTDASGQAITATCTVDECPPIVVNATCTPESSPGANDGTASSNASGGCPPLSYLWSNGETTPDISGLSPGWYVVTVTDDEGCTAVDSCEVLAASCPPLTISVDCDTICPGASNGTATATASGGCAPYSYAWSNGGTGATVTGLSAGQICVTVTDNDGNTATSCCTVDECPSIVVNATCTPESSPGANDGTASSNASGGCPPLSYLWSTGATTADISGLSPGWYVVTVTDGEGCTAVDSCEVLAASCPPLTISVDCDTICPGANNGTATATASGGCAPYSYAWSNGGTGATVTGLSAGQICVTVTDSDGSSATACCDIIELDDQAPVISCPPDETVIIPPGSSQGFVQLDSAEAVDNCPPVTIVNDYNTGGPDASDVFPVGTTVVEFTATDPSSNASTCTTELTVIITPIHTISGEISTEVGTPVNEAIFNVTDTAGNLMPGDTSSSTGEYQFSVPGGSTFIVTPEKDNNPLDGVTTADLINIQRHILFIQLLGSPYKIIAADINDDGVVSTADLVELQSIIIGIFPTFLNNSSYRFTLEDYIFANPTNPLAENWPEEKTYVDISQDSLNEDWIAIKIGDVTDATSGLRYISGEVEFLAKVMSNEDGSFDLVFGPGEEFYLSGYQLELKIDQDQAKLMEIDFDRSNLPGINHNHFYFDRGEGLLRTNWWHQEDILLNMEDEFFRLRLKPGVEDLDWTSAIELVVHGSRWESEAYAGNGTQWLRPNLIWKVEIETEPYKLYQNRPNPFSRETIIPFLLPHDMEVTLELTDVEGRLLKTTKIDGVEGLNEWKLSNDQFADGVIFYRIITDQWTASKRMLKLR
ncbi:MAG: HYR domain-containing protein [Saprospirales bacterium]|nr:MAG: HYR domain-containing protein [Saprospirales bacterium]